MFLLQGRIGIVFNISSILYLGFEQFSNFITHCIIDYHNISKNEYFGLKLFISNEMNEYSFTYYNAIFIKYSI